MHVNHWPWSGTVIFTQNITWCWIYSTTLNIIKMFHSHIKMYRTLVIWKYASVYIRCFDIDTIVYMYIYHTFTLFIYDFVYITLYYIFPLRFVPIIWHCILWYYMPLYIVVLPGICRVLFYFFLYFYLTMSHNAV